MVFQCRGARLVGVVSLGEAARGVVVVVGGPQYRAGSHRQFVELARALSAAGTPVLRFDYRGMGDSEGRLLGFEHVRDDIRAAIDALFERCPAVNEVVLWGLCDAASAAVLYAPCDRRVTGVALLNPWVRSAATEARAYLRHYYVSRILSREFWSKLIGGGLDVTGSLRSLAGFARAATRAPRPAGGAAPEAGSHAGAPVETEWQRPITLPRLAERMAGALEAYHGRVLLITSGKDLTAAEFLDVSRASRTWRRALARESVTHHHLEAANHTFASTAWKRQVEAWTGEWLRSW